MSDPYAPNESHENRPSFRQRVRSAVTGLALGAVGVVATVAAASVPSILRDFVRPASPASYPPATVGMGLAAAQRYVGAVTDRYTPLGKTEHGEYRLHVGADGMVRAEFDPASPDQADASVRLVAGSAGRPAEVVPDNKLQLEKPDEWGREMPSVTATAVLMNTDGKVVDNADTTIVFRWGPILQNSDCEVTVTATPVGRAMSPWVSLPKFVDQLENPQTTITSANLC